MRKSYHIRNSTVIFFLLFFSCNIADFSVLTNDFFLTEKNTTTAHGFSPRDITGCVLWLDADDSSSINLNGSNVSQWNDKSGSNNHAVQTTAGYQPELISNYLNGKDIIRFGETTVDDFLSLTSTINMQPATVFIVVRYILPAVNAPFLGNDSNSVYFGYYTNIIYYYSTIASLNIANTTPSVFQIIAGHAQPSGTNSSIRINGISVVTGNFNWLTSSFAYIGRRNAERFKGDIAEIIIYNTNINSIEIDQIENYLSTKYNITIP